MLTGFTDIPVLFASSALGLIKLIQTLYDIMQPVSLYIITEV